MPAIFLSQKQTTICKKMLFAGDMIVLSTDGVNDSFESEDDMCDFVNNLSIRTKKSRFDFSSNRDL